jgi:hypothetical protein
VFRIGVTGHRALPMERLDGMRDGLRSLLLHVRDTVRRIGEEWKAVYADNGAATLVVVSPLARGADRLVAREAHGLGFLLDVPTPYDLTRSDPEIADPRNGTGLLYARARAQFVLDGIPGDYQAYVEVGRRVVDNADLLIAFWDGRPAAGPGGTAEIVRLAREHDVPVIHFHTERSGPITLWAGPDPVEAPTVEGLLPRVTRLLELALIPPDDTKGHASANLLRKYFGEHPPNPLARLVLGKAYAFATGLVSTPTAMEFPHLPADCVAASRKAWREDWAAAGLPAPLTDQVERKLLEHFAWANHLSILYAIRYRSAFFWIYCLAFIAVASAVIGHVAEGAAAVPRLAEATRALPLAEVASLGLILFLFLRGRFGKFHEKWVDYRSLAERIRHLGFLMPLGTTSPAIRVPVPAQHADPSSTWLNWLFRAIVRQAGLFMATVDPAYLTHCRALLQEHILRGQAFYHERLGRRLRRLHRTLHVVTIVLFGLAMLVALVHVLPGRWHCCRSLLFASAVLLPTLGAAIHGFLSQGDFENVALRAQSAHEQLTRLLEEVGTLYLVSAEQRLEIARATRREQIAALDRESLREIALRAVGERLDAALEPAVGAAVPDLERHLSAWRETVLRLDDEALRRLLEGRPLREFPPAASAELSRYARHVADIMGDDLIGWRADSQVRPLVLA